MRKFTKKKNRIIFGTVFAGLSVALVAGLIVGDVIALGKYASVLESAFGNTGRKYTEVHYDGVDPIYYEREYSDEELLEAQQEFALNTGREGMVLLEEGNLPYAENTKISLFSKSSVDFIFGISGAQNRQNQRRDQELLPKGAKSCFHGQCRFCAFARHTPYQTIKARGMRIKTSSSTTRPRLPLATAQF